LARWPGRIQAGSSSDALIAHLDMAASFASLVGMPLPDGQFRDSFNVTPALLGQAFSKPLRPHFIAHTGGIQGPFSIQVGDWKYMETTPPVRSADSLRKEAASPARTAGARSPGLFHLAKDLSEEHNLAETETGKVVELKNLLHKLRETDSSR
jgi:arylsulfatase A-like enzyme